MIFRALLFLVFSFLTTAHAVPKSWTTEKPLKATVTSFDQSCISLKAKDGSQFKVTRKSLYGIPLVAGKTEIHYFKESMTKNLCVAEKL